MIYLADPDLVVFHGDALQTLRRLPADSVHMCVTSPPFYGLRDYGTGQWEGGDPDCDHVKLSADRIAALARGSTLSGGPDADNHEYHRQQYRDVCGKCGARRIDQQIGLEATPDQWVQSLVNVFREVRRILRNDGTLWVEVGDSYANSPRGDLSSQADRPRQDGVFVVPSAKHVSERRSVISKLGLPGIKQKDLIGAPWLLAFALRADGWYLRSDIIWARPNPMPESVTDRPTKSHSYLFLLSKSARYFYDADAVRDPITADTKIATGAWDSRGVTRGLHNGRAGVKPDGGVTHPSGRNKRSVWTIPTEPLPDQHYAAYPQALVEPCILAGTSERGVCPDCGAPWLRETERELSNTDGWGQARKDHHGPIQGKDAIARNGQGRAGDLLVKTTGWRPSCAHQLEPVPAVVLDPFLGSGTTALVARRLGRRCVGIELSAGYCALTARRTQQLSLLAEPAPTT